MSTGTGPACQQIVGMGTSTGPRPWVWVRVRNFPGTGMGTGTGTTSLLTVKGFVFDFMNLIPFVICLKKQPNVYFFCFRCNSGFTGDRCQTVGNITTTDPGTQPGSGTDEGKYNTIGNYFYMGDFRRKMPRV